MLWPFVSKLSGAEPAASCAWISAIPNSRCRLHRQHLEDDPIGYVALGIYRWSWACETSLCQIALPAPLRQCLASTSACVTQTGPARHGKHRPLWSCILCRGMSTGLPRRTLSGNKHDTKATNKANGSSRLPAFSFRCRDAGDGCAGLRRARDDHAVATARRDDRPHAEVTRTQFYRCINPIRRGDREPVNGNAFPPSLTLFLLACAARQSVVRQKRIRTTLLWQLGDSASPSSW